MNHAILSLIIFGICIFLFILNKWSFTIVALLGLVAMVLTGVCTFSEAFKTFGSSMAVLIASMMVVGRAAFQTGFAQIVGEKIMAHSGNDERRIVVLACLVSAFLSAFLQNSATLTLMIYISAGICSTSPNVHFKNLVMPVAIGSVFGGMLTLIGSTPQLTAHGLLEEYLGSDSGFSFFTLTIPALAIVFVMLVYVALIGYPLGKKLWGSCSDYSAIPSSGSSEAPQAPNRGKLPVMSVIFIVTILLFVFSDLIEKVIPGMDIAIVGVLSAAACVIFGCISGSEAIRCINWKLIIWLCAGIGMGGALNTSGGGALIANTFLNMLGQTVSPFALYAAFVFLACFMTQFLSNSTALAIILPIMFSMTAELGYNSYSFAVGITLSACIAVLTPIANNTIALSTVGGYKFSDYFKYSAILTIGALGVVLTVVPLVYPLA